MAYDPDALAKPGQSFASRMAYAGRHVLAVPTAVAQLGAGMAGVLSGGATMYGGLARKALGSGESAEDISKRARAAESAPGEFVQENAPFAQEANELLNPITSIFNYLNTTGEEKGQQVLEATNSPLLAAFVETSFKALPYLGVESLGVRAFKGAKGVSAIKGSDFVPTAKELGQSLAAPKPRIAPSPRFINVPDSMSKIDVSRITNTKDQIGIIDEIKDATGSPLEQGNAILAKMTDAGLPVVYNGPQLNAKGGLAYHTFTITTPGRETTFGAKTFEDAIAAYHKKNDIYENIEGGKIEGHFVESGAKSMMPDEYVSETAGWDPKSSAQAPNVEKVKAANPIEQDYGHMTIGEITKIPDQYIDSTTAVDTIHSLITKGDTAAAELFRSRYAAQQTVRKVKDYAVKLAKDIAEPVPANVDVRYKMMIDELRNGIDPAFRSDKTLSRIKATEQYLRDAVKEDGLIPNMPKRVLDKVGKKSVNDLTLTEIKDMHDIIYNPDTGLLKKGQVKFAWKEQQRARIHEEVVGDLLDTLGVKDPTKRYIPEGPSTPASIDIKKQTWKERLSSIHLSTLIPQQVFDILDSGANFKGKFHEIFYSRANIAHSAELLVTRKILDEGTVKMKSLGISLHDWSKRTNIGGIELSRQQALDAYLSSKNAYAHQAWLDSGLGKSITEAQYKAIIKDLTPQEKAFGDHMMQDYAKSAPRLDKAMQDSTNNYLVRETGYSPMMWEGDGFRQMSFEDQLNLERSARSLYRKALPSSQFIKERVGSPGLENVKLNINAVDKWISHTAKREHYIANVALVKQFNKILSDNRIINAVGDKEGKPALNYLRNYANDIANPSFYKAMDDISNISRALRRNTASAYLVMNLPSAAMQVAGLPKYLRDAGPGRLIASAAAFAKNPVKLYKEVCEMEPQIKDRYFERETAELAELHKTTVGNSIQTIQEWGMKPTMVMDKAMVVIGYHAVYNKMKPLVGHELAKKAALEVTLRTQNATHPKDLAPLYKMGEPYNWALMFTNDLSKSWGEAIHTLPADIKAKRYASAALTASGMGMMATIAWVISHKALPQTHADVADMFTEQSMATIPLVGNMMVARKEGYSDIGSPVMSALSLPGELMSPDTTNKKKKAAMEALAIFTGLPLVTPRRIATAIKDEDVAALVGPRKNIPSDATGVARPRVNGRSLLAPRKGSRGSYKGRQFLK